jgi:BirA family transcriptional regulator, biotin operon repressor / biotin---[acetyl-CoA-carboxylase] ligase
MEAAHAAAADDAPHGTAVVATVQTGGRGQRGRVWSSAAGGLWLSVVARPTSTEAIGTLAIRVGLAIAAALEEQVPGVGSLTLKWPNDLLLEGRKLGGILTEARWSEDRCLWVVIGVGLNVRNILPEALARTSSRLADIALEVTPDDLLEVIATAVAVASRTADPLADDELVAFAQRDALRGRPVQAPMPGTADGITATGALLVRTAAGAIHECVAGVVPADP